MSNSIFSDKVKCNLCDELIERGILRMIVHHEEKHGLHFTMNNLMKARTEKGSALTLDEAYIAIRK